MHIHSENEVITPKKTGNLKSTLIHLVVAVVAVVLVPWILNLITGPKIAEIRQSNPQYNNNSQLEYYKGRVNRINGQIQPENAQDLVLIQQLEVKPLEGPDKDQIFALETQVNKLSDTSKYKEGDTVVLVKVNTDEQGRYFVSERYRLDQLNLAIMFFVVLVLVLVGIRGVTALAGLVFSVLALTNFLIPMILIGQNVVLITFLTGLIIMTISLFLSHGFNKVIVVSLIASGITITLSTLFSIVVVYFTKLTGTGSEDAYQLQFSNATIGLNFQGLFLSAMIIGTLGVLDDITTSQAATVSEISRANPKLSPRELYFRGLKVGHEHIISLVNTLGLAYVSVALPLLMYYIIYNPQPLWVSFNSENIVEEIVRTIVGSSALLLAVPITTFLAANFLRYDPNQKADKSTDDGHNHDNISPKKTVLKTKKPRFVSVWITKLKDLFKPKPPSKSKELIIFEKKLEPKIAKNIEPEKTDSPLRVAPVGIKPQGRALDPKQVSDPDVERRGISTNKKEVTKTEKVKVTAEIKKSKLEDKKEAELTKKPDPKPIQKEAKSVEKNVLPDYDEKPTQLDLSGKNKTSDNNPNHKKRIQL